MSATSTANRHGFTVPGITPADAQAILDGKPAETKREFVNIQGD